MNFKLLEKKFPRGGIAYELLINLHFELLSIKNWILNGHFFTKNRIRKFLYENEIRRVNFGADNHPLKDFLNTGIPGKVHIDITKKLPFSMKSINLIFSSHVIEHIYRNEFKDYLKESYRILKDGGIQIICVPSLEKSFKKIYGKSEESAFLKAHLEEHTGEKVTSAFYLQGLSHMFFHHKFLYDLEDITYLAKNAGYKQVYKTDSGIFFEFNLGEYVTKRERSWKAITECFILKK